jgi:hypothetical protein
MALCARSRPRAGADEQPELRLALGAASAAAGDKAVQVVGGVNVIHQLLGAASSTSFVST